jgi:hypothetical protein
MVELNTLLFTAILWIQECQLMLQIITTLSSVVRIQKARTALLLDHPFFGTLLFRLGARACRSIATVGDRSEPREGNARALRFIRMMLRAFHVTRPVLNHLVGSISFPGYVWLVASQVESEDYTCPCTRTWVLATSPHWGRRTRLGQRFLMRCCLPLLP